jgi:hypothetical protein
MADISVTQSAVKAADSNTLKSTGVAGEAIDIGKSIYLDPGDGKVKKAQANNATHTANLAGVALTNAQGDGQPIVYGTDGNITFQAAALTTGQTYVVSAGAAGGIAPVSDLASTNYVGVLGVATSATNLKLRLISTSAQKP